MSDRCPHPEKKTFRDELGAKIWAARQLARHGYRARPYRCLGHWHITTIRKGVKRQ